jgi:hypothetical protein
LPCLVRLGEVSAPSRVPTTIGIHAGSQGARGRWRSSVEVFVTMENLASKTSSVPVCLRPVNDCRWGPSQIVTPELDNCCVKSVGGNRGMCHPSVVGNVVQRSSQGERTRHLPFRNGRQFQHGHLMSQLDKCRRAERKALARQSSSRFSYRLRPAISPSDRRSEEVPADNPAHTAMEGVDLGPAAKVHHDQPTLNNQASEPLEAETRNDTSPCNAKGL